MFNWFKKNAVAVKAATPELEVVAIQGDDSITPLAMSESEALKNQGNVHLGNGKLDDAAACFRQAIACNPRYAEAYTNLGFVLQMQGNLDEAVALFRKAVLIKPSLLPAHLNLGMTLLSLGQIDAAEESMRRVIALAPEHPVALQSLGVIAAQRGDFPQAETLLRRALDLQPDYAEAHNNLGNLLQLTKRLPEAEASYRRALELQPDDVEAHNNLATLLQLTKRLPEAEASYRRALELKPDYVNAHNNLGKLLVEDRRLPEAEASYRRALELKADYAEVHINLGILLVETKRLLEAETSYRRALELKADYAEAHFNLGNVLEDLGQPDDAVASFRRALQIKPDYAVAHSNLGNTLNDLGRTIEAEASFRRALQIKPDYADAHYNLGNILKDMDRSDEAEASYRRALQIKPDHAQAYNNLGTALQRRGKIDDAVACFRRVLEVKPDLIDAHSNLIFTLDLMVGGDTASLHEERKRWDTAHAAHLHQRRSPSNIPDPERRLRIGYVSADFREHSAPKVFGGMLTRYDRSQFDVFVYSNNFRKKDDRFTDLFKQSVTAWRNIASLSDDTVAEMIREDGIDILVDLSGYTAGNRLLVFARKPAPIQITAWGYATGTGMRAMDVFFTDPVMVPPQDKHHFTEEVRYLPSVVGSFFTEPFPDVNELPALSDVIITFGSLNRLVKVSAETYCAWAEVLLAVPCSRLILKTGELNDAAVLERVVGHFTKAGVAAERIIMQGRTPWHEHMQAYNQIDIALDPFPHGGGVTALEGLMMGVPVITLRWPTVVGRLSASIMTTLGLTDWIAETQEQYVALAIRKASDLQSLAELRQQLRGMFTSSIIGDQVAYTRAVEQEYRLLWKEWCANCPPVRKQPTQSV